MVRYGKRNKRVALYLRVSTGEQTTRNQRRDLEAAAERHGWAVAAVFEDAGVSGAKGRKDRPGLDAMLKAVGRREVDLIMAWSVDRLGRSLVDLLGTLQELHAKEVDLYLHQQDLDSSTPSGRAMFQMMGVFSEFERAMIEERVKAGLARAKEDGVILGRPMLEVSDPERAEGARNAGTGCRHPQDRQRAWGGCRHCAAVVGVERPRGAAGEFHWAFCSRFELRRPGRKLARSAFLLLSDLLLQRFRPATKALTPCRRRGSRHACS